MQTKLLCVLIQIWTKGEVSASWIGFKPTSKIFLLTVRRRCFFCGSFMLCLSRSCYVVVRVCLLMLCGHLLGKGWPFDPRLWCLIVKLSLSHLYMYQVWCLIVSIPDRCPLSYFQCDKNWLKTMVWKLYFCYLAYWKYKQKVYWSVFTILIWPSKLFFTQL